MRMVKIALGIAASLWLAGCSGSSVATSPSKTPSAFSAGASAGGSFGVFAQAAPTMPVETAESAFARCLKGAGDESCFSGSAVHASPITFEKAPAPTDALSNMGGRMRPLDAASLTGAPSGLSASVFRYGLSTTVSLYWTPPTGSGSEITNYLLQAGSSTGRSDIASFLTGVSGSYPYFSTNVAGSGTFYIRVLALTAEGYGPPSNEIVVTVGDTAVPGAPYGLSVAAQGPSVTLNWYPPYSGGTPTSYIIQASSTRGGPPDLANFATGNTSTTFSATGVAPGTYFVRVLAANNAGVGQASSDATLLVIGTPTCATAPNQPANLVAVVNGSTVTLAWSPSTGATATSYVVEAGSSSGLANLANFDTGAAAATTQATGVGAGTYYVRVRGKNACGASVASSEVVVVVR